MRYQNEAFRHRERLLLDTALDCFKRDGWEKVTVAEVAAAAGIAKGTVYKHFLSKESIYAQLALEFSRACLRRYLTVPVGDHPLETMRELILLAFNLMREHPVEVQLSLHCERPEFQQRLEPKLREAFQSLDRQYTQLFNDLLDAAVKQGEIERKPSEPLYWGVDTMFQGVMARIAAGGFGEWREPVDLDAYFHHVANFIIAGIHGASPASDDDTEAQSC